MTKTNILHIRDSLGIYGAERVILTLAKHSDRERFHFSLLCMRRKDGRSEKLIARAKELGVDVIPVDVAGRFDFSAIMKIRRVLKQNRISICHAHDYKSVLYMLISSVGLEVKRVATAHGSTRDSLLKKIYLLIAEQFLYRFVDRIIAVSEDIRAQLQKQGVKPEKIKIILNGIDGCLLEHENAKASGSYLPSSNNRKVFAVIGRLFPDKGHRFFLNAFLKVLELHPTIMAFVVGAGPEEEGIKKQIRDLRLENHVYLCGERTDMKNIYEHIDYLVIPSLREGLPYVLLEAMLYKIPVLATAVGEIPALVRDGITGYLVQPEDVIMLAERMRDLYLNSSKAHDMAEKAYVLVTDRYSAERMVRGTEALYTEMLM